MIDYFYYILALIILGLLWVGIIKPKKLNFYLYIIHAIFGLAFLIFTKNFQADSLRFYILGSSDICPYIFDRKIATSSGLTYCISGITKLIINNYGFSTGIFSFLGFLGLNIIFNLLQKIASNTKDKIEILYFFSIPSISFWTSGIGKDSLMILFYGLILNFIAEDYLQQISKISLKQKQRIFNLISLMVGLIGSYLTRTYTLYFFAISIFFSKTKDIFNIFIKFRLFKSQLFLIPFTIILLYFGNSLISGILSTLNSNTDNLTLIGERALRSQISASESGGSYVNQVGLMKILLIIGGPFSIKSFTYIAESFVGIIFISIFFLIFKNINFFKNYLISLNSLMIFILTLTTLEFIKIYLFAFNTGIIVRQRIIPLILIYFVYFMLKNSKRTKKIN